MPDERRLELPGYPGGSDIIGNWVNLQFQLDAFGEALLLLAAGAARDISWRTTGAQSRPRSTRSVPAGRSPTPASGNSTRTTGRTAA